MTAVNGGGYASWEDAPDLTSVRVDVDQVGAWQKFSVRAYGNCTYTIQTAKGWYLGTGKRGTSTRLGDPENSRTIGYEAEWELAAEVRDP